MVFSSPPRNPGALIRVQKRVMMKLTTCDSAPSSVAAIPNFGAGSIRTFWRSAFISSSGRPYSNYGVFSTWWAVAGSNRWLLTASYASPFKLRCKRARFSELVRSLELKGSHYVLKLGPVPKKASSFGTSMVTLLHSKVEMGMDFVGCSYCKGTVPTEGISGAVAWPSLVLPNQAWQRLHWTELSRESGRLQ